MMAHAAMAALDLDVLGAGGWLFHAALPREDAVGGAEARRGRHRGRCRNRSAEPRILFVGAAAARHLIDPPGIGRLRIACKRAAERDHRAHAIGHHLGELARVDTAQAPADQADLAPMRVGQLMHQIDHRMLHAVARPEVAALTPAARRIAAALQEAAQRTGRRVRSDQARQHQSRMAVTPPRQAAQRISEPLKRMYCRSLPMLISISEISCAMSQALTWSEMKLETPLFWSAMRLRSTTTRPLLISARISESAAS